MIPERVRNVLPRRGRPRKGTPPKGQVVQYTIRCEKELREAVAERAAKAQMTPHLFSGLCLSIGSRIVQPMLEHAARAVWAKASLAEQESGEIPEEEFKERLIQEIDDAVKRTIRDLEGTDEGEKAGDETPMEKHKDEVVEAETS